ncbi:MAG TPA: GNAT family N-acetyltransferase [Gammaproteobacteria bacterium]|nr:GNAT family N-acetyltransferase [Gammaproteobacteria bacterium]
MAVNLDLREIRDSDADIDLVAPLFDGYRQFYKQVSDLTLARQFLADRLRSGESVVFVAFESDKPLGFVQLYPSFSSVSACRIWILNDLFVVPESRGRGVGRGLMERARRHASETGARQLVLETAADNPAQKLYESLGYVCQNDASRFYMLVLP